MMMMSTTKRMMMRRALGNATDRWALGEMSMTTNAPTPMRRAEFPMSRFGRYRS